MRIKELIKYEEKSKIKAGDAVPNGKYPLFTSSEAEDKRYDQYTCDAEGIIMGTGGNATLHYYNGKFAVSTDCLVLKPNKNIKCKYLYYFFKANMNILQAGFKGAGLKHTNKNYIENIELNRLPDIKQQLKIICKLDKISSIIQKHKQVTSLLDILIKSQFIEQFGDINQNSKKWKKEKLSNLCEITRGGSPRPINDFLGGDVPWIKISDASKNDNIYINSTKEHIIKEGISKSRFIKKGSLIFANCGVSLGFCRILNIDGCIHDGWLAFSNIDKRINKVFLLYTINQLTDYFRSIAPGGTQPNLNTEIMGNYEQILPPIEKQEQFIAFSEHCDKFKIIVQKSLNKTQILFNSLMQKYFK